MAIAVALERYSWSRIVFPVLRFVITLIYLWRNKPGVQVKEGDPEIQKLSSYLIQAANKANELRSASAGAELQSLQQLDDVLPKKSDSGFDKMWVFVLNDLMFFFRLKLQRTCRNTVEQKAFLELLEKACPLYNKSNSLQNQLTKCLRNFTKCNLYSSAYFRVLISFCWE